MTTAVVLQSNYLPWKGYFDLVHDADIFVFYDDVQFTKNDWRNRNKVKTAQGAEWMTIPVGADERRLIQDVTIPQAGWQIKHWKTIQQHYGGCAHFNRYRAFFEDVYLHRQWLNLSQLNQYLIRTIASDFLGVKTEFVNSSDYALAGQKQERLLDLLAKIGAQRYVSGPSARDYIEPIRFAEARIDLFWKDYANYPEYPQRHPPFQHGVSILDLLFNTGPEAPRFIWGWRAAEGTE